MPKLIRFALLLSITLVTIAPHGLKAQEDDPADSPSIVPVQGSSAPPVIIDETDSSGVSDVDSYED